jgi:gamma-glutamyltranspeptidase
LEGDLHKRESLANTLKVLAEEGSDAFYKGRLGQQIIEELRQLGSNMTMQDLSEYK